MDDQSLMVLLNTSGSKDIFGPVQLGSREPLGTRHFALFQHRAGWFRELELKIVTNALPERLQVGGAPGPQRVVAVKIQAFGLL